MHTRISLSLGWITSEFIHIYDRQHDKCRLCGPIHPLFKAWFWINTSWRIGSLHGQAQTAHQRHYPLSVHTIGRIQTSKSYFKFQFAEYTFSMQALLVSFWFPDDPDSLHFGGLYPVKCKTFFWKLKHLNDIAQEQEYSYFLRKIQGNVTYIHLRGLTTLHYV